MFKSKKNNKKEEEKQDFIERATRRYIKFALLSALVLGVLGWVFFNFYIGLSIAIVVLIAEFTIY